MGRLRKRRRPEGAPEATVASKLSKDVLRELYLTRGDTMTSIAKQYGCSRQYVSLLCQRYGIRRQSRSRATGIGRGRPEPELT